MQKKKVLLVLSILVGVFILWFIFSPEKVEEKNKPQLLYQKAQIHYSDGNYNKALDLYQKIVDSFSEFEEIAYVYYYMALVNIERGHLLEAREILRKLMYDYADSKVIKKAQKSLEDLNMEILFSPIETQDSIFYTVKEGDTLSRIAGKYNTTVYLIKKSNNLDNDIIRPGMDLKVVTSEFSIIVLKSQRYLTLKLGDNVLKTYKVSVGRSGRDDTPTGEFEIINKLKDPVWFKDGRVIPPGDPDNLLGSRWMGLSKRGYGIHGTIDPDTIGQNITEGCIRMYEEDVQELYAIVPVGTRVKIIE